MHLCSSSLQTKQILDPCHTAVRTDTAHHAKENHYNIANEILLCFQSESSFVIK